MGAVKRSTYLLPLLWLLAVLIISFFVIGRSADAALDIAIHDNYFVVPSVYFIALAAVVFGILGAAYYLIPRVIKRRLNLWLGLIHLLGTIMCMYYLLFPVFEPRRYYSYSEFPSEGFWSGFTPAIFTGSVSQAVFIVNVIYSIFRGPRIEAK